MVYEQSILERLCGPEINHLRPIPVSNPEDRCSGLHGAGDALRCGLSGGDGHLRGSNGIFTLIVYHGVSTGLHGGGGEIPGRRSIGPVLCGIVVPVFALDIFLSCCNVHWTYQ